MDQAILERALRSDDPHAIELAIKLASHPLYRFTPRLDRPELLDQQSSFYGDRFAGIACVLAGNGAGKSYVGAAKVADFLLNTPPPESNTPFWIASQNMEMATGTCWCQNLSHFIPTECIQGAVWYSAAKGLPRSVLLRPHANGNSWLIEFKSYDQGRAALQGANIAGFWLDEQAPFEIITEMIARTRKWSYPGSQIFTLTPVEPDLKLEEIFTESDKWPDWRFYRMNTRLNTNINLDFVRQIESNEIDALVETRLTGAFATFQGAIYKEFDAKVHVIEPMALPKNWTVYRGLDLGWSHATACVWAAHDPSGPWYVFREYYENKTSVDEHVKEINRDWDGVLCKGQTYADPEAAQVLHEMEIRGLHTVPANKEVKSGIGTIQGLLRCNPTPKLFIFNTCPNLIREMRTYVWDAKTLDKPKKQDDHCVDALRYCLHSAARANETVKLTPIKAAEQRRRLNF